ncbi:universal stress protein [Thermodesulfovibrionales bacterium]|nr:universal stress protein [Thermodesulfovibrionales bacterium]
MQIKNILFSTDFSEGALQAMPYAFEMAKNYKARLHLLHVMYDIAKATGLSVPRPSAEVLYDELEPSVRNELEKFGLEMKKELEDVQSTIIRGVPYEEILKFAREKEIDLIVIGTHGRKGLDRILFGSTAERVVRHALCPVLTVRVVLK